MNNNTENNTGKIILKSYPLHNRKGFMTYNLYSQDSISGITKSQIIKYPCIKEGCKTTCYFDATQLQSHHLVSPCQKCWNQCQKYKVYLDVGLKDFIEKHYQYINQKRPLNVQINPLSQQFVFPNSNINNDLIGQLSDFMGHRLMQELKFDQSYVINLKILDFVKINQTFQNIMQQQIPKTQHLLYSFCKYHPQPNQNDQDLYLLLFVYAQKQPIKVKIITEENRNFCDLETYLKYVKIALIGNLNTLFFAVPFQNYTQYYVTSLDYNYDAVNDILTLINFPQWKEDGSRCRGNLIVDQKRNSVISFGGYDQIKGKSLDYMCCFIHCRWQIINKHHRFCAQRKNSQNFLRLNRNTNKQSFAFRDTTLLIYSQNQEENSEDQMKHIEFMSLGGTVLNPNYFRPSFSAKYCVRHIIYDCRFPIQNPIIDLNDSLSLDSSFCANNLIIFQIPSSYKEHSNYEHRYNLLVFGGTKIHNCRQKTQFNKIYLMSWNHMGKIEVKILPYTFDYAGKIAHNIDSCVTLLRGMSKNNEQFYLRGTYPFHQPFKDKQNDHYVHYLIVQFGLTSKQIRFSLGTLNQTKRR